MRTLQVFTINLTRNGITIFALERAEALSKAGISMDFAAQNAVEPGLLREIEARGIRVHRLPGKRYSLAYVRALSALIRREGYDLVHAHGNSSSLFLEMLAAKLAGCRARVAHSHNTTCLHLKEDRLLRPLFYPSYTAAAACGEDAGRWLFPGRKFTILPNAVDVGRFGFNPAARAAVRARLRLGDSLVVGHVGRFNDQKNHPFLLKIFEQILKLRPDARLLLVGDGFGEQRVRALAQPLGDSVIFTGSVPDPETYLSAMDIMLLPSLYEGFPTVLMEWQSAGLPALVSDTVTREAKLTELVAFMSLSKRPEAWAEALLALPRPDRAEASRLSAEKIHRAGYDLPGAAEKLVNFYTSLF